ncbi:MAG TPA: 16S rRNA (guanine(966)-N(2))-methyltransferase RsmD [Bacilli bacterium]|nr:16S rRNA (guanine(966)-N(2))-methyltransferase RsmD [Bacilli bacterium]
MKIVAGKYRTRQLHTLEGLATRPTITRTREAIFNSMGQFFRNGETVLDVFGGSGALSFESISRGAKKAIILDSSLEAISIIKKNAMMLRCMDQVEIIRGEYKDVLPTLVGKYRFDIIFLDPPFRMKVIDELVEYILKNDLLASQGMIMAEYPKEDIVQKQYSELRVHKCAMYASSEVTIFKKHT